MVGNSSSQRHGAQQRVDLPKRVPLPLFGRAVTQRMGIFNEAPHAGGTMALEGINLETAVERARWCVRAGGWREATTLRAGARKEKRQSQTPARTCQRARSGLTQTVSVIEGTHASTHAASRGLRSGQLPFLGSYWNVVSSARGANPRSPQLVVGDVIVRVRRHVEFHHVLGVVQ